MYYIKYNRIYYCFYLKYNKIDSINSSKNKAINAIIELENIEKVNVYTIGDGYNDIEMINNLMIIQLIY